jgi:CHAD domain-containing protein
MTIERPIAASIERAIQRGGEAVEEIRLIVPPGTTARLRVHPLLQAPAGDAGIRAEFSADELTLSSRAGDRAGLLNVAVGLADVVPLRFKMRLRPAEARHAADLDLPPAISLLGATSEIFGECLTHLMENVAAAGAGEREAIHQARVAIRRLRAAMALFRPCLDRSRAESFDGRLRQLGHILGAARDWDVFQDETFPLLEATLLPRGFGWLNQISAAAARAQRRAHDDIAATLTAPPFTHLVLGLAAWIESGPVENGECLRDVAPNLLDRMAHRAAQRGSALEGAPADQLHSFRKSLKKLRYSLEFIGHLFAERPVKPYLRSLKDLQAELGSFNDAHVVLELIAGLIATGELPASPHLQRIATWSESRASASLTQVHPMWKSFSGLTPPWRSSVAIR